MLGVAVCIVLASILAGGVRGSFRALGVAVGGVAVAFVLNVPWAVGVVRPGADWSGFAGIAPAGPGTFSLGQILRFETGSLGAPPLGWAFLVVGALALVIGRGWRLGWAARAWTIAAVPFAMTWVAARGWIDVGLPSADALLAPAAVGLALAAGLGIAAFEVDLRGYRFGWRQLASLIAAGALAVGVIPALIAASGRSVARAAQRLRRVARVHGEGPASGRIPRACGSGSRAWCRSRRGSSVRASATARPTTGPPDVTDLWAGTAPTATQRIAESVTLAADGSTDRLGSLLGPMGIRYIVVPEVSLRA